MRSFIKSHKRIGSFGKDDKEKKDTSRRNSATSASYSNDSQGYGTVTKQASFELLSTNNPNVHNSSFSFNGSPLTSPKVTSPISPLLRHNDFNSSFIHSPGFSTDEFTGSAPSSPKTLAKQYSLPLDMQGPVSGSAKKKILKYPKNLFSRSSNSNLRETKDSQELVLSPPETFFSVHQWDNAQNHKAQHHRLSSSSDRHEDEFYFKDYNQMASPPHARSTVDENVKMSGNSNVFPIVEGDVYGERSSSFQPSNVPLKVTTGNYEHDRRAKVSFDTLSPDLEDFKSKIRNFNPSEGPVIYEEARNKSLQRLLGEDQLAEDEQSISEGDGSSYSNFDKALVLNVVPKEDEPEDKRASTESSKSAKRDSFKNVLDKMKNYKRKSGGSDRQRSSIASVIDDNRVSVIQINTDKRASILKKLKNHESRKTKKFVSIREIPKKGFELGTMKETKESQGTKNSPEAPNDDTSSTMSDSSAFSFEKDLINGRNVSIKYYKSMSEANKPRPQRSIGLYVDDFNADEYGEEDFNDEMNYYDEMEEDDTEHLFNRQLFSDDEDEYNYDDLMNEVGDYDDDSVDGIDDGSDDEASEISGELSSDRSLSQGKYSNEQAVDEANNDSAGDEDLSSVNERTPNKTTFIIDENIENEEKCAGNPTTTTIKNETLVNTDNITNITNNLSNLDLDQQDADSFKVDDLITNISHVVPNVAEANSTVSSATKAHILKSSSETFQEEGVRNRYSWLNQDANTAPEDLVESFYEDDTLNDYFADEDYLDEVNIVPEDFEFDPDASYHIYDSHRKTIVTPESESDALKNRMYRSNSYSKKPKPGQLLTLSDIPSQNNRFVTPTSGKMITLFNTNTQNDTANQVPSNTEIPQPISINANDFLSPITEGFSDDACTPK